VANRYWVGGTASWDGTIGLKWALTSGGVGGQLAPTSSDTVFFDANSGANTVTIGAGTAICSTLTMTGFTGVIAFGTNSITIAASNATIYTGATTFSVSGTPVINCTANGLAGTNRVITTGAVTEANAISFNITAGSDNVSTPAVVKNLNYTGFSGQVIAGTSTLYGNLTCSSTMSHNTGNTWTFAATSGVQTITSNGKPPRQSIGVNGVGGTVRLLDDFAPNSSLSLTNGTFDANGQNLTIQRFSLGVGTKSLIMGSGTWTISGTGIVWNLSTNNTGLTFSGASAPIVLSNTTTTARTFSAGTSLTYNSLTIGGTTGTSTLTISGTTLATFTTIASTKTVAHTISLGVNLSVGNWTATGTAGNIVTVNSSAVGTQRVLTYTGSGTISMDYMSITDINFSYTLDASNPYLVYAGANSTNGGNNNGIAFIAGTTQKAYRLTTGTSWTVPADWNNASNTIHMIGAGGGGATAAVSGNNRASGGGGGGGGYTVLTNQTITGAIPYTIGTSASNANGGSTTFNTTNIAGGGLVGTATTAPLSTGGVGGTGVTFNGGTGGAGSFGIVALTGYGAGAGGGAGGPNGIGGNGGSGFGSTTAASAAGGGGGGNGGGTAGGNASLSTAGAGGNNFGGTGGGTAGTTGGAGTLGGGGGGNTNLVNNGGAGGSGIDISNTIGGAGGRGASNTAANTGLYGGGGSGGYVATNGAGQVGGAGSQGVIFIVYSPSGTVINNKFFLLF